jgi:hypothetical protein
MANDLSTVDLKISEIIDVLLLHPESEVPPEHYKELGEHLVRFKLQNSQDSLGAIRSMISTFEINREVLEGDYESDGEPDNQDFWYGEPEETGGAYSDDESFTAEFGEPLSNKAECLMSLSSSRSTLTAVEQNVVLGLIIQIKKDAGGYNEEFLTTMQDTLQLVGFSTPQVWEVMTQHLNPESQRFNSADVQYVLQQESDNSHEYN